MSDLPPPSHSVRAMLSIHALVAVGIMIVVALSGGDLAKALGVAAVYFLLAGGWSWLRAWRAGRNERARGAREQRR
jgi:hypothetical protein